MKNIKLIVPAIVITCFALTSCNKTNRLQRETYKNELPSLTSLTTTLDNINHAQKDENGIFKLDKGTMTMNFNSVASGSFYAYQSQEGGSGQAININNMNFALDDVVTIKWDVTNNYLGISNKMGENLFITKVDGEWGTYYLKEIAGKKYYRPIDNAWFDQDHFKDPKNYFVYVMAENTGLFERVDYNNKINIKGLGLDISGFGGDLAEIITNKDEGGKLLVSNFNAPGLITNDNLGVLIGDEIVPFRTIIDALVDYQKQITNPAIPLSCKCTNNDEGTGATINLGVNKMNLANSNEIIAELASAFDDPSLKNNVFSQGSGDVTFDYFVNFKDDFIHQQEIALDVNQGNLQLVTLGENDYAYINMKHVNVHTYINQTVELGKCDYQMPDTTDFNALQPISPDPEF